MFVISQEKFFEFLNETFTEEYSKYCMNELENNSAFVDDKVISLDKVKQAREDIDDLYRYYDNDYYSGNIESMFKCDEVLEILDKLIAESEGE